MGVLLTGCNAQELESAAAAASAAASDSSTSTSTTSTSTSSSDGSDSDGGCAYTVAATYSLGVNPLEDFVVHYAPANEVVSDSSCDGVTTGETKSIHVDVITRHGTQIHIDDSLNLDLLDASNTDLTEATVSNCDGVYRVDYTLQSGTLDTFANKINVSMKVSYVNDGSCGTPAPTPSEQNNSGGSPGPQNMGW